MLLLLFLLAVAAEPALARGSFSTGGRAGFSTSAGRGFSTGSGFSGGGRSFGGIFGSTRAAPASPASGSLAGGSAASPGGGYSTGKTGFSTPRASSPPAMYRGYGTDTDSYGTGRTSYSTGRGSYSGGGTPASGQLRFPDAPPVGVFGPAPQPPAYYQHYYLGLPWWMHLLFQPNYYYTPWGYHFFTPRLLTWLALFCLLGLAFCYLMERVRRRR